jgi:hypothetical protein
MLIFKFDWCCGPAQLSTYDKGRLAVYVDKLASYKKNFKNIQDFVSKVVLKDFADFDL